MARDEIAEMAVAPGRRREFLEAIAERGLFLAEFRDRRRWWGWTKEVAWDYREGGAVVQPLFTSEATGEAYLNTLERPPQRSFSFVHFPAEYIVQSAMNDARLLVNPKTRFETELTEDERKQLRMMLGDRLID